MSKKYKYEYVSVITRGLACDDYKKIIDEHAEKGWRFVTTIEKTRYTVGAVPRIDLVFEKEIE